MAIRPQDGATLRQQVNADTAALLTPAQAGKLICASRDHIYRLVADGVLRAVDVARPSAKSSKTRIRRDDLQEYIERMTRGSPPRDRRDGSGVSRQASSRPRRSPVAPSDQEDPGGTSASMPRAS